MYEVGGAAIAVTVYDERRTLDVHAVVSDRTVLDEARPLAESEGIPPTWLNENARPWTSSMWLDSGKSSEEVEQERIHE